MIKPKRLEKGDTIGIVAPASPLNKISELKRAKMTIEKWGYKVKIGKNAKKNNRYGYLCGKDNKRVNELNEMFADPEVDAIIVTQGGYGSARLLDQVNYDLIKNNPKIFIGFSDITSLHSAIYKKTGLVTFHGPSAAGYNDDYLTDYRKNYLFKAITEKNAIGEVEQADDGPYLQTINKGKASAEIVGGNLSLLAATIGTEYEIDTEDKILFIEDVEVEPWILDHTINHMRLAGKFADAAAIIIGEMKGCVPRKINPGFHNTLYIEDIINDLIKPASKPTLYGLTIGHGKNIATLPLGVKATLDATNKKLFIEERATIN